jgi:hypothetical protein
VRGIEYTTAPEIITTLKITEATRKAKNAYNEYNMLSEGLTMSITRNSWWYIQFLERYQMCIRGKIHTHTENEKIPGKHYIAKSQGTGKRK